MPNLSQVVKVTKEQMQTLIDGGNVEGHTLQDDVLYAVENEGTITIGGVDYKIGVSTIDAPLGKNFITFVLEE